MAEVMSKVLEQPVNLRPPAGSQPTEDLAKIVAWFNDRDYEADIPALRIENKDLITLEDWLKKNNW
jgi:hypothetical protein